MVRCVHECHLAMHQYCFDFYATDVDGFILNGHTQPSCKDHLLSSVETLVVILSADDSSSDGSDVGAKNVVVVRSDPEPPVDSKLLCSVCATTTNSNGALVRCDVSTCTSLCHEGVCVVVGCVCVCVLTSYVNILMSLRIVNEIALV